VVGHGCLSGTVAVVTSLPTVCGSAGSVRNATVPKRERDQRVRELVRSAVSGSTTKAVRSARTSAGFVWHARKVRRAIRMIV
jgi:hypothetical protein